MTLDNKIISFLQSLEIKSRVPKGITILNPYRDAYTIGLCRQFYKKYYRDKNPRTLLLGINPGRFGSGLTGISFTDPVKLETDCQIPNTLLKKTELSADFIYRMIHASGGVAQFCKSYFISAISPLGFTKDGKNINYYDLPALQKAITPFVVDSIQKLLAMGMNFEKCFCIGEGKNYQFFLRLNDKHKWFSEIIPLAHPRFIMQYRRKKVDDYVADYLKKLS